MLITGEKLKHIALTLSISRAEQLAHLINEICPKYGITNKDILEEFLATVLHESGEFNIKIESLNYTTAKRITAVWPSRFNLTGEGGKLNANNYVKQPILLANTVYNGRMGNRPKSNDGWDFRGGGFIQLTGRETYEKYAAFKGEDALTIANKVRSNDYYALDSACWEFVIDKKLIPYAEDDDFRMVTKRINGGLIGMADREMYLRRCKQHL